jgi:hypothetical protein
VGVEGAVGGAEEERKYQTLAGQDHSHGVEEEDTKIPAEPKPPEGSLPLRATAFDDPIIPAVAGQMRANNAGAEISASPWTTSMVIAMSFEHFVKWQLMVEGENII